MADFRLPNFDFSIETQAVFSIENRLLVFAVDRIHVGFLIRLSDS